MADVVFTDQALSDINEIAEYIGADSFRYAQLQVKKFFSKADMWSISH